MKYKIKGYFNLIEARRKESTEKNAPIQNEAQVGNGILHPLIIQTWIRFCIGVKRKMWLV